MGKLLQSEWRSLTQACVEKIRNEKEGVEYVDEPPRHVVVDNFRDPQHADPCLENILPLNDPIWVYANDVNIEVNDPQSALWGKSGLLNKRGIKTHDHK